MHKDIENIPLSEADSEIKTKFIRTFKKAYLLLGEYGSKKQLHLDILQYTSPKKSASLIRRYCSRPEHIPRNQQDFFYPLIGHLLFYQLNKQLDEYQLFFNELKELLKEFELQIKFLKNENRQ
jgi:hypothetical protein